MSCSNSSMDVFVLVLLMFGMNVGCVDPIYLRTNQTGKFLIQHLYKCVMVNENFNWICSSCIHLFSPGIRRTGPCSVSSLKKGDLGFRWDSPYIHSSINGNKNHWLVYPDGNMELLGDIDRIISCTDGGKTACSFFFRCWKKSNRYETCHKIIEEWIRARRYYQSL